MKNQLILVLCAIALTSSCIDDKIIPPFTGELNPTAEMLVYFESLGDFPNTVLAPAIIEAEEVYNNLNTYLIIDIREKTQYSGGHIETALNIQPDSLPDYLEVYNRPETTKVVLVSRNGQSSAYFTCLLRLTDFKNIYTLHFGMAAWNEVFADEWFGKLENDPDVGSYINEPNPKNDYSDLPQVVFENPDKPIKERVNERIKEIISSGFREDVHYRNSLTVFTNDYLVCYGEPDRLYYEQRDGPGHHPKAIFYKANPLFELKSIKYLQSLPTNETIFIYDGTGELSACITAYLRSLGYDAVSLLFGGNQLFYDRMLYYPELEEFAFTADKIKNYPFKTGS